MYESEVQRITGALPLSVSGICWYHLLLYYANRNLKFQGGHKHISLSIYYKLFLGIHLLNTNVIVYVIQDA